MQFFLPELEYQTIPCRLLELFGLPQFENYEAHM